MTLFGGALAFVPVLAARGRAIQKLLDGDPVAWTILGVVVAIMIVVGIVKSRFKKGGSGEGPPPDAE